LYAGRAPAAAPATGIAKIHDAEQAALINAALHATATEDSARETTRLTGTGAATGSGATAVTERLARESPGGTTAVIGSASPTPLRKSS